ncbi:MAG: PAS domain-containing protein [Campylobacterales bacterium]|nr:PAS domain-containing protein [Campylobacterales bacterium]
MDLRPNETTFPENEMIVSKTDLKGNIIYGNEIFIKMSEYTEDELLDSPHNLIRHPDMPQVVFKYLWETLQSGKEVNAYVVNRSKSGKFYWVFANVTPSYDNDRNIIGYHSARRKPTKEALSTIEPIYKLLRDAEKEGGMEKSEQLLMDFLKEKGVSYEEFIFSI